MNKKIPIIIPLDGLSRELALATAKELSGKVWGFKVEDLLIGCGVSIISELKQFGNVFADPKLHTIPNTVANSVIRLERAGADFITVHASGGIEMMRAAVDTANKSKILAVTIITSLSEDETRLIYGNSVRETVIQFARNAGLGGVYGIVCSPQELKSLNEYPEFQTLVKVTPGIRPIWYQSDDDQKRTMTPKDAIKFGADFLVIGRPILQFGNLLVAVKKIKEEI